MTSCPTIRSLITVFSVYLEILIPNQISEFLDLRTGLIYLVEVDSSTYLLRALLFTIALSIIRWADNISDVSMAIAWISCHQVQKFFKNLRNMIRSEVPFDQGRCFWVSHLSTFYSSQGSFDLNSYYFSGKSKFNLSIFNQQAIIGECVQAIICSVLNTLIKLFSRFFFAKQHQEIFQGSSIKTRLPVLKLAHSIKHRCYLSLSENKEESFLDLCWSS